jgi:predicted MPP superfamily phosphohydrolase
VAVIADPHFGGVYVDDARLRLILDRTTALEPDLILLLGDYGASGLDGAEHRVAMTRLSAALPGLSSPLGTYAIIGNHDWWDDPDAQSTGRGPVIAAHAHEPDVFPQAPARYALTLSGHTHGGQIRVLGRTPVVPSMYGSRYAYGHIVEDERHLIVSGGLGTSLLPVRIGSRPEIVHLLLG